MSKTIRSKSDDVSSLDAAWRDYREGLEALRDRMLASPLAADSGERVRAQRWLLQAQAAS
jgi:hypothetical protein